MSDINYNHLKSIEELKDFHFIVEEYQRGYKWGIKQINELLKDINNFSETNESFYCLQPIVVNPTDNHETFALIDGQQRLTTIYIILKVLKQNIYSISYQTRESSEEFLNNLSNINTNIVFEIDDNLDDSKSDLNKAWKSYINNNHHLNNVDNYHFYHAYQFVYRWINNLNQTEKDLFSHNLICKTKIIWYNPEESQAAQTAEEKFIRFNQGKISLAQAELIKALFVIQFKKEPNTRLRESNLNHFAEEWNEIESNLQDDRFWFFISNDVSDKHKSNRIDFLFDLYHNKPITSNNNLYSYHKYNNATESKNNLNWNPIKDLYNLMHEWYEEREIYHLIGYLVHENILNLRNIYKEYKDVIEQKNDFANLLKEKINDYFTQNKNFEFDVNKLNYIDHKKEINSLLILHNIINYQITDDYYRFPFDKLKKEQGWSLEHIHAQNAEKFNTNREFKDWFDDIKILIEKIEFEEQSDKLKNLETLINNLYEDVEKKLDSNSNITNSQIKPIQELVDEFFDIHNIGNICLIDGRTNTKIGNKKFKDKRKKIMEIVKSIDSHESKPFIPLATKLAFLKYFTDTESEIQFNYWSTQDREYYRKNIVDSIQEFLKST